MNLNGNPKNDKSGHESGHVSGHAQNDCLTPYFTRFGLTP